MLNRCEFIGNLGADPEVRSTNAGKQIVSLRLAVTEKWRGKDGERQERTEWVSVVIFNENLGKVAAQYLKKGSRTFISGALQTRKWQDQSGADRYTTEVVLQNFRGELILLDSKQDGPRAESKPAAERGGSFEEDLGDSIPFGPEWR